MIAAELYLSHEEGRPRCGDVQKALADETLKDKLALAAFDIVELDGEPFQTAHYKEVHAKLKELLSVKVTNDKGLTVTKTSGLCKPVEMCTATSVDEVKEINDKWVGEEGAEGLVVHNGTTMVCKVKPRHTIDAAVIGYTTGDRGIRDMLFAVRHENGDYQMFASGSNGLSDEQRAEMAERLSTKHVESQYVLSDSRGIAYQMVVPEVVAELSVLELVARGNDDKVKTNPLLQYDAQQGWLMLNIVSGVSAMGVTWDKERTDKQPTESNVRVSQLTDLCPFEEEVASADKGEASEVIERRVYKKVSGAKVMLHKFLIWKTNKENTGRYPAYVLYHTDYSSGRKELIKRDMAFSSSEEQIREILAAEIANNVKKGWEEVL